MAAKARLKVVDRDPLTPERRRLADAIASRNDLQKKFDVISHDKHENKFTIVRLKSRLKDATKRTEQ
jgi:hypothetical protein